MNIKQIKIPDNWSWSTMGEIAVVVGGGTPKTNEPDNFEGGSIPWLTPADLSGYSEKKIGSGARNITQKGLDTSSAKLMPPGTVLFTSRAPIGYVVIASNEISTNQGFKSFVLKTKDILPDYVYWWLKGNKDLAESYASGTTFLELSGAKAKQLPIPIAPLDQQKRIVAEIEKQFSRLDEAVANLKRVKANLKRYKAAVLKAAVEGKLTEEWRKQHPDVEPASKILERILAERRKKWEEAELAKMKAKGKVPKDDKWKKKYKEPSSPEITDLPKLPAGWVWANLELLKEFSLYGPRFSSTDYSEKGVHVLRTSDINESGKVNTKKTPKLDLDDIQYEKYKVDKGDLLITRTGSLGTLAVYNDDVRAIPGAYLIQYRLATEQQTSWFLFYFFKSPLGLKQIIKGGAGVGRPNLNAPTIEDIKTPFPSSSEQKEIIRKIEDVFSLTEKLKIQVEVNLLRAERLQQSILMKAFSGKFVS